MKTKVDLYEEIEILRNSLENYRFSNNILKLRLEKLNNYLISTGKTQKEINLILKLDGEKI